MQTIFTVVEEMPLWDNTKKYTRTSFSNRESAEGLAKKLTKEIPECTYSVEESKVYSSDEEHMEDLFSRKGS